MSLWRVLSAAVAATTASTASAQFQNPGFESGSLAPWVLANTPNGRRSRPRPNSGEPRRADRHRCWPLVPAP